MADISGAWRSVSIAHICKNVDLATLFRVRHEVGEINVITRRVFKF